jgi:DNA-binding HxlR family transcriptional regulator
VSTKNKRTPVGTLYLSSRGTQRTLTIIPGSSKKMLTQDLRKLEADGIWFGTNSPI